MNMEWLWHISPCVNLVGGEVRREWVDALRLIYDHELMCFGEAGRHRIEIGDEVYECPPNSFVVIPPGRWHTGMGGAPGRVLRTWVHFDWTYRGSQPRRPLITFAPAQPVWHLLRKPPRFVPPGVLQGPLRNPERFFESHERLAERHRHGGLRERATARALLLEMLLELLVPEGNAPARSREQRGAARVREALDSLAERPFATAPAVKEYLGRQGRSYDHQARLFKSTYGITPLQYVNSQRIERARNLLRDTELPVSQVAYRLGFGDVVYFNRLFRKVSGMTPGRFRESVKKP
jgi:AraC family transcriptional regulator of arabinose operon/AraC family transcriptional regulator